MTEEAIGRPALRYHGGKWKLAPWIIGQFPEHVCYVEPFGGGASVLLRKPLSKIEVYNDRNELVVNFFRVLREQPADLIAAIDLTPYSRSEFKRSQEISSDPLESARRCFVWSQQGRGRAGVKEPGGWRFMRSDTRSSTPSDDWDNIDHLWEIARRLKRVQIECDDALKVIRRYDSPETLFYVDPPYVQETRCYRWASSGYQYEYSDEQHRELIGTLKGVQGKVIISGYPSALYEALIPDWEIMRKNGSRDNSTRDAVEALWLSPSATKARKQQGLWGLA